MDQLCYLRFVLLLQQAYGLVAYTGGEVDQMDADSTAGARYQAAALDRRSFLGEETLASHEMARL